MTRTIGFDGIREGSYVTFASALTKHTDEDKLVKVSANGTVALCGDNEPFHGIVRVIDGQDKGASVQIDGFVTMSFDPDHADPALGWQNLICGDAPTLVTVSVSGDAIRQYLVVSVDSAGHTVTFLLG
jgi:hypothetical protein